MLSIVDAKFALQPLSVESDVPISGGVDEFEESRNNGVKSVG